MHIRSWKQITNPSSLNILVTTRESGTRSNHCYFAGRRRGKLVSCITGTSEFHRLLGLKACIKRPATINNEVYARDMHSCCSKSDSLSRVEGETWLWQSRQMNDPFLLSSGIKEEGVAGHHQRRGSGESDDASDEHHFCPRHEFR